MLRDYGSVVSRIEAFEALESKVEVLSEISGYPVFRVIRSRQLDLPVVMINSGTHGDAPASVEGALQFLEGALDSWLDDFQFEVIPCLNPYGYVHDQRENELGIDINWAYLNDTVPEINIVKEYLSLIHI